MKEAILNLALKPIVTLALILLVPGCTSEQGTASHSFRVFTENGITIAETTGGPKYDGELFEYVETLRLKQDDLIEESLLSAPLSYIMDSEGAFYVRDNRPARIVCFDPQGYFSHTIGRQGDGPGEYRRTEIQAIRGDTLLIFDNRLNRATRYRTDGTLVDVLTTRYRKTGPASMYYLRSIRHWNSGLQHLLWDGLSREDDFQCGELALTILDADGEEVSSIEIPPTKLWFMITSRGIQGGSAIPFIGEPQIRHLPDGRIVRSTGETSMIDLFSNAGDPVGRIVVELPQEKTAPDEQRIRAFFRERIASTPEGRGRTSMQATLDDLYLPEFKAFWSKVIVDESGFYWLKHPESFLGIESEVESYRVLSPEGEYLGDTQWMDVSTTLSHGHLLTIQTDEETEAPELIVYKIHPVARGLRYPR